MASVLKTNHLDSFLWTGLGSHVNLECSDENILLFAWSVNLHWQPRVSLEQQFCFVFFFFPSWNTLAHNVQALWSFAWFGTIKHWFLQISLGIFMLEDRPSAPKTVCRAVTARILIYKLEPERRLDDQAKLTPCILCLLFLYLFPLFQHLFLLIKPPTIQSLYAAYVPTFPVKNWLGNLIKNTILVR